MAERLNVEFTYTVKDSTDNSDFMSGTVKYSGIPYGVFVALEKSLLDAVGAFADKGVALKKGSGK